MTLISGNCGVDNEARLIRRSLVARPLSLHGGNWEGKRSSREVKKGLADSRPQPGCHLPNSPSWLGIIYPVPVPERFGQNKSRNIIIFVYSAQTPICYKTPEPDSLSKLWGGETSG